MRRHLRGLKTTFHLRLPFHLHARQAFSLTQCSYWDIFKDTDGSQTTKDLWVWIWGPVLKSTQAHIDLELKTLFAVSHLTNPFTFAKILVKHWISIITGITSLSLLTTCLWMLYRVRWWIVITIRAAVTWLLLTQFSSSVSKETQCPRSNNKHNEFWQGLLKSYLPFLPVFQLLQWSKEPQKVTKETSSIHKMQMGCNGF